MDKNIILKELVFKAVRSSGSGGQHVNKVATKVELSFDVMASEGLSDAEKQRLVFKLEKRLNKNGLLMMQTDESRSQYRNKQLVIKRFFAMLAAGLRRPKTRVRTKPSRAAIERRLKSKKKQAEKKANRKNWKQST
ncbi:alternative ribosome rescue aminoacyl-tRNA hydrolase ArfB [Flagellimonas sp. DF-77]|uniref:alternative ribosome rescue aminoacyl-tRNA hydrolase ArfB n=1 Tax=Flagellimonas algarum TaxID=3230298 RepID=UPI003391BC52